MTTHLALTINPSGPITTSQWTGKSSYAFLKKALNDGCLSCIHMPKFNADMWVDDEFLFKGFEPNLLATKILRAGGYPIEYPVYGSVAITGGTTPSGDTKGLTKNQMAQIQALGGF